MPRNSRQHNSPATTAPHGPEPQLWTSGPASCRTASTRPEGSARARVSPLGNLHADTVCNAEYLRQRRSIVPATAPAIVLRRRAGMTLVELLVVIGVIVLLMGIAVPAIQSSANQRRVREAARALNVYLGGARNHALETGRPCGVMIQRMANLPQCSMVMDHVAVPAPYGGESVDAVATVQLTSMQLGREVVLRANLSPAINTRLVSPGDLIQLNNQGPWYTIVTVADTQLTLRLDISNGQIVPWSPTASMPMPYKIMRKPLKSHGAPLQLPAGAVIDLQFSGWENAGQQFSLGAGTQPIVLVFSPKGSLERIYYENTVVLPTQPVYLLIGARERVPAGSAADGLDNWQDRNNLWVTVNAQTGLVTTHPVAAGADVFQSREFARKADSLGGR